MAHKQSTDTVYTGVANSARALLSALTAQTDEDTHQSGNTSIEEAKQRLEQDVKALLHKSSSKIEPAGYGLLPPAAIKPMRELHKALGQATAVPEKEDIPPATLEEVERSLLALARSTDPRHPFILESSVETYGDEEAKQTKKQMQEELLKHKQRLAREKAERMRFF